MPRCCGASFPSEVEREDDEASRPQSLGLQVQDADDIIESSRKSSEAASATTLTNKSGTPRNKTALAPGHSLMDWIRLGNSGVDMTGVGGIPRVVSLSELATHNKQDDAWMAIRGMVFNVTHYMEFHPGGVPAVMAGAGKDATKIFDSVHAWVNYQSILQKCVVGVLSRSAILASSPPATTENAAPSPTNSNASNQITSAQENVVDSDLASIKINWWQTSNSISLFYESLRDYPGVFYQLTRINDTTLAFKLFFEKHIITHQLEMTAEVEWPPVCTRNTDTMEMDFAFTKQVHDVWKSQGNQTITKETNTNNRTYTEYELVTNKPLSKLVHMLVFRAKDFLQVVPIGKHVEIKMNVMGMEVSRSYTPVPPCLHPDDMVPNYKSDCLCFMIKKYPKGALSPSITALQTGQTVLLSNALGAFVLENFDRYSVIHMVAGGTGLTAMLSIIQRSLAKHSVKTINLVNFNKNEDNMFYATELGKASTTNDKLKVTHILSEASSTWTGKRGSVSDGLLEELVAKCTPDACVYLCGPWGFMQAAKSSLEKLDWKSQQMYEFDD